MSKKGIVGIVFLAVVLILVVSFSSRTKTINVNLKVDGSVQSVATATPAVSQQASAQVQTSQPASSAPATSAPAADTQTPAADTQTPADDAQTPADDAQTPADDSGAASAELSSSSSKEDIVAEYIKVYNTTKATGTFTGHDAMECNGVELDGKENGTLTNLAGTFMSASGTDMQLPPYSDDNPAKECLITADDVESATYTDNGDGTATIKITPKSVTSAKHFEDPQGKMFNVMEDVASAIADISVISWSEGDANSNVTLITEGGYAEVTYDKSTKMMTKADYVLVTIADVQHANVLFFKDKAARATFTYTMSFPG